LQREQNCAWRTRSISEPNKHKTFGALDSVRAHNDYHFCERPLPRRVPPNGTALQTEAKKSSSTALRKNLQKRKRNRQSCMGENCWSSSHAFSRIFCGQSTWKNSKYLFSATWDRDYQYWSTSWTALIVFVFKLINFLNHFNEFERLSSIIIYQKSIIENKTEKRIMLMAWDRDRKSSGTARHRHAGTALCHYELEKLFQEFASA